MLKNGSSKCEPQIENYKIMVRTLVRIFFIEMDVIKDFLKVNEIKCSIYIVLYNTMLLQGFVPSVLKLSTVPLMMMLL